METHRTYAHNPQGGGLILKSPMLLGFMLSLLAGPVHATITLPNDPLTTGSRVPPNVLFILDDSGSMAFDYMPDSVPRINGLGSNAEGNAMARLAYTRNTLSYNPAITYQPWVQADGTRMTGGTSYTAAYGSYNLVGGTTINLGDSSSCQRYNYNDSASVSSDEYSSSSDNGNRVCGGEQVFYVPIDTARTDAAYLDNAQNYYRYRILANGASIERSQYGTVARTNQSALNVGGVATWSGTLTNNSAVEGNVANVAAARGMEVVISNPSGGDNRRDLDYELLNPSGGRVCNGRVSKGQVATCTLDSSVAGQYKVRVSRRDSRDTMYSVTASTFQTNSCGTQTSGTGWINCTSALPNASRTLAQELTNYATWFSYSRSRMKAAKAGAGLAFAGLGQNVRVGYRTIWGRNGASTTGNWPRQNKPIPVNNNNGLFVDPNGATGDNNNRSRWYSRLYSSMAYNGTPLHNALDAAGQYFSSDAADGAYGPLSGNEQLSCRQNFSVLTTDGYWNNVGIDVGEQDNANGTEITGPGDRRFTYQAGPPYAATQGNTLADVAMRYWKNDLRTDLTNNVPSTTVNPAFWQHMVTFGIALGVTGETGFSSVGEVPSNFTNWPTMTVSGDSPAKIDDLLHAALNGRGQFVSAADPEAFANGLAAALAAITERTGSFSNVGANSTSVDGGTRVYQASYISGVWTGELVAYPITNNAVSNTPSWRASNGIPTSNRKIFAGNAAGNAAVAFPAGLSDTRLEALARTGVSNYPVTGAQNAAYLAGERSLEQNNGGTLRNRNNLLGDVVTSSPAYVKDTDTIYVGANDGMLHAINAANGTELFAYIPGGINWSNFAGLSRPDYAHRYFVDGPIVVSNRTQTPDKNILVGALGKGGKGLYALDVSSPDAFSASSFKWEVRDGGGLMGLVQSKPIIAKLNTGVTAVITANGINSTTGQAALLVYNLETGAQIAAINTNVGSAAADAANSNGLTSAVGWDADGNGTVDYVYGGDMLGNVWKFNLAAGTAATWSISGNAPMFTATDSTGTAQPITGGLTLALHPRTYQPWLFFGTGRMLTAGDLTSKSVQTLYGFVDDGTPKFRSGANANLTARRTVVAGNINGMPVRSFEARQALPTNSKGWYLDLLEPPAPGTAEGERVISDAQLFGDVLIVSTVIPTADACQADGRGYLNALDAFTGTSTGPSLFDLDGDGNYDDETLTGDGTQLPVGSVDLGVGMPTLAEVLRGLAVVGGSSGSLGGVKIRETRNVGRVSWREVISN